MSNEILKALKYFNLSEYEAHSYLSLNYMITATAKEVSDNAKVPRSKIYDILRKLEDKGFVEVERGRPLRYTVVPPTTIFANNKNRVIDELQSAEEELIGIYENQLSKLPAPIWLVYGEDKILTKCMEIIKKAKKTINIRFGFLFNSEINKIAELLNKKIAEGVEVNIMAMDSCLVDGNKINMTCELKNLKLAIKPFNLPNVQMIIRDGEEMIHIFTKLDGKEKNIPSKTAIGVWNQYEDVTRNYDDRFLIQWKKNRKTNNKGKK